MQEEARGGRGRQEEAGEGRRSKGWEVQIYSMRRGARGGGSDWGLLSRFRGLASGADYGRPWMTTIGEMEERWGRDWGCGGGEKAVSWRRVGE